MKVKIILLGICLFCQLCTGQILTRKNLHGLVVNDSTAIESGFVLNVNSKTKAFIGAQGIFDINAKSKDTLLFTSFGFKTKMLILDEKNLNVLLLTINMQTEINELDEVVVKKTSINPNLGNIQSIIDKEYIDDNQSEVKSILIPTLEIENGMNLIRIGKMLGELFKKESVETKKEVDYGSFYKIAKTRVRPFFFTTTLNLKEDEIGLFLIYCEADKKAKALLNPDLEFQLIDFLLTKNTEFKSFTTFEH